jgi:molecular chaperone GrpE
LHPVSIKQTGLYPVLFSEQSKSLNMQHNSSSQEQVNEQEFMNEQQFNGEDNGASEVVSDFQPEDNNSKLEQLKSENLELKDKYLRLVAEFDNFRKRNAKERLELIQTAGKEVITQLLEVLDDCDRAEKQLQAAGEKDSVIQGVQLVFNKLRNILQGKGLQPMNAIGTDFDADKHEAITQIPSPSPEMKGKVVDELEKGYYLNDKIIRFAKVVVGK